MGKKAKSPQLLLGRVPGLKMCQIECQHVNNKFWKFEDWHSSNTWLSWENKPWTRDSIVCWQWCPWFVSMVCVHGLWRQLIVVSGAHVNSRNTFVTYRVCVFETFTGYSRFFLTFFKIEFFLVHGLCPWFCFHCPRLVSMVFFLRIHGLRMPVLDTVELKSLIYLWFSWFQADQQVLFVL